MEKVTLPRWDELLRTWIGSEFEDSALIQRAMELALELDGSVGIQLAEVFRLIREDPSQALSGFKVSADRLTESERQTLRICFRLREALASDLIINAPENDRSFLCEIVENATDDIFSAAKGLNDELLMAVALRLSVNAHFYRQDCRRAFSNALAAAKIYRGLVDEAGVSRELMLSGMGFCLERCGNCLAGAGRPQAALRFQRLAVKIYEELVSQDEDRFLRDVAMAKHNMVNFLIDLERFEEARLFANEVVNAYGALASQDPNRFLPNFAYCLVNHSKAHRLLGEAQPSVASSKAAVHLFTKLAAKYPDAFGSDLASAYHELSLCSKNNGQSKAARRFSRLACHCFAHQKAGEGMVVNREVAHAFQQWAICLAATGCFQKAMDVFEQSVLLYEQLLKHGDSSVLESAARCFNEQSVLLSERGRLEDSIHPAQRSYELYRALGKRDVLDLAIATANLAGRHFKLGRVKTALKFSRESLKHYRRTGLGNDELKLKYSGALLNFATYLSDTKNLARTLPPMKRAVALAKEVSARTGELGQVELARTLTNYTTRLRENNRIEDAIEAGKDAVTAYRRLASVDHERYCPSLAAALNNLASCFIQAEQVEEGLKALEEGSALLEALTKSPLYQDLFLHERFQLSYNKALFHLRQGEDGYEIGLEALRAAQEYSMKLRLQFRSPAQRKRIQEDTLSSHHWHVLVCTALWFKTGQHDHLREAFEIGEQIRGRGLNDLLSEGAIGKDGSGEIGELAIQYARTQRQLGDLENIVSSHSSFLPASGGADARLRSEMRLGLPGSDEEASPRLGSAEQIERRKTELNEIRAKILEVAPDWSPQIKNRTVSANQVASSLSAKSAFLQLTIVKNGMLALIVRGNSEIDCVNMPGLDLLALQNFAMQWQAMVGQLAQGHHQQKITRDLFQSHVAKVSGFFPQNFRDKFLSMYGDIEHLVICPNGPLHLFPLHLCQVSSEQTLGELFQISYTPSGSAYCRDFEQSALSKDKRVCLATGVADDLIFGRLEARILDGIFKGESTTLEAESSPSQRDRIMAEAGVFSFSGHAYFDRKNPIRSGIRLKNGTMTIRHFLKKPRLPYCRVAVLNGCESGFLQPEATDDFVSLPAALLYSGARAVVATLWSTSDLSASFFGIKFHEGLKAGLTSQDAFHAAINWLKGQGDGALRTKAEFLGKVLPGYLQCFSDKVEVTRAMDRAKELLEAIPDEDPPFSHPLHWAPYVLHGKTTDIIFPKQ